MESFSSKVKEELSKINNLSDKNLVKSELQGYLLTSKDKKFITENEYNINRFSKLLSNSGMDEFTIEMIGNKFCITTKAQINFECKIENEEEAKAIVRGSFMGAGSITNPNNKYHLEIVFWEEQYAKQIENILKYFRINSKRTIRGNKYIVYIKDGEDISNFLALIGAKKALLEFEDTRVIREVRNNVNRIVNCETANLNKVIKTSVKQIEAIKLIKKKNKFGKLSEKEKELANLRLQNPDATLLELGKMLNPPIGKSGVNHRMKAIEALAEEIKKQ
jgi:DNA-binding protein WhiA